jgi:hypothetical protein
MTHEIDEQHLLRLIRNEMVLMILVDHYESNEEVSGVISDLIDWSETEGAEAVKEGVQMLISMQEQKKILTLH